jgi:hypothetical protein
MDFFKGTKKQISPCIASKIKYALNLKTIKPKNTKKCSENYWIQSIESIVFDKEITDKSLINSAIKKYDDLIVSSYGKNK